MTPDLFVCYFFLLDKGEVCIIVEEKLTTAFANTKIDLTITK